MCDNVEGFKKKLLKQLKRHHKIQNLGDAFRVYLNGTLQNLQGREPMLIVAIAFNVPAWFLYFHHQGTV